MFASRAFGVLVSFLLLLSIQASAEAQTGPVSVTTPTLAVNVAGAPGGIVSVTTGTLTVALAGASGNVAVTTPAIAVHLATNP